MIMSQTKSGQMFPTISLGEFDSRSRTEPQEEEFCVRGRGSAFASVLARQASGALLGASSSTRDEREILPNRLNDGGLESEEASFAKHKERRLAAAIERHMAVRDRWRTQLEQHLWGLHGGVEATIAEQEKSAAAFRSHNNNASLLGIDAAAAGDDIGPLARLGYQWRRHFDQRCPGDFLADSALAPILATTTSEAKGSVDTAWNNRTALAASEKKFAALSDNVVRAVLNVATTGIVGGNSSPSPAVAPLPPEGLDRAWQPLPSHPFHGLLQSARVTAVFPTSNTRTSIEAIPAAAAAMAKLEEGGETEAARKKLATRFPNVAVERLDLVELLGSLENVRYCVSCDELDRTADTSRSLARHTNRLTVSSRTLPPPFGQPPSHLRCIFSNDPPANPATSLKQLTTLSSGCVPSHEGLGLSDAIAAMCARSEDVSGANTSMTHSNHRLSSSMQERCRYYQYGPPIPEFPTVPGGLTNTVATGGDFVAVGEWLSNRSVASTNDDDQSTGSQQIRAPSTRGGPSINTLTKSPNVVDGASYGQYVEALHSAISGLNSLCQHARSPSVVRDATKGFFSLEKHCKTLPQAVDHTLHLYCQGHEVHGNFSAFIFIEDGEMCALVCSDSRGFQHEVSMQLASLGFEYTDKEAVLTGGEDYDDFRPKPLDASADWLDGALFVQNTTSTVGATPYSIQPVDALVDVLLNLNLKVIAGGTRADESVGPAVASKPPRKPSQFIPRARMSIVATFPFTHGSLKQIPLRTVSSSHMLVPVSHVYLTEPSVEGLTAPLTGAKRPRDENDDTGSGTACVVTALVPYTRCVFQFGGGGSMIPPRCWNAILAILEDELRLKQFKVDVSAGPVHDAILSDIVARREIGDGGGGASARDLGTSSGIQAIGAKAAGRGAGSVETLLALGVSWRLFASRLSSPFWVTVESLRRQGIPLVSANAAAAGGLADEEEVSFFPSTLLFEAIPHKAEQGGYAPGQIHTGLSEVELTPTAGVHADISPRHYSWDTTITWFAAMAEEDGAWDDESKDSDND